MSELKVGIVGLGWVAGAHIEAFQSVEGATVSAVCSRREHRPDDLEAQYGQPLKATTDYNELLADPDIDIIDVCTPHPLHRDQIIAAAEAGKHVLIEKPITLSFEDTKAVRDAIRVAGVQSCVCFECRYSAHFSMIRSVLDQGLLGELHYAEVDYYHGIGPWYGQFAWNIKKDFGGSSLLTAGCHALDALLFFMDDEVEEVTSYGTKSRSEVFEPYEYDSTSTTILKFSSGKIGKVASSIDCFQPYYFHVHLVGSEGSLLDNKFYSNKFPGMVKTRWSRLETALIDSGDVSDHPYQPQFQAFVDCIGTGEPMPLTDLDTAFETHRVVHAADLSAREGRPVKIDEFV